jgi:hypothetical protein
MLPSHRLHPLQPAALIGLVMFGIQAIAGCGTTPTLPLPPPVATVGAPSLQGLVRVEGQANEDAYVTVLNTQTDLGRIGKADNSGYFSVEIEAQAGDKLEIWQESDGIEGEHIEQLVPAPSP